MEHIQNYYDVCNDYSLDQREKPADLNAYRTYEREIEGQSVTLHVHKKHGELHYLSSKEAVTFEFL